MDRKHNLAFYQTLKYFPCRIYLSSPASCIQIIYLRRSHNGRNAIFEKVKREFFGLLHSCNVILFSRALCNSQSVLISSLLTSFDVFSLHRVSIKRGVNACFRRLLRVPVDVPSLPTVYYLDHLPGPVSKVSGQTILLFKVLLLRFYRRCFCHRYFRLLWLHYTSVFPTCQAVFPLFSVFPLYSMFCTNSPALFCAFCTPCPLGQIAPAVIMQAVMIYRIMPLDHSCRVCPVARLRGRGAFSLLWWYQSISDRWNSATGGLCGYTGNRRIVNRWLVCTVDNRRTMIDNQYNQ